MLLAAAAAWAPPSAAAQEVLCDAQYQDCRTPLLQLIRNERVGIDVAFWFMEDARYVAELVSRHKAGVPVRILVDQRANATKRLNETTLTTLRDNGIPMRDKYVGDVLHFKMMLFHGQNVVEFSKANYSSGSLVAYEPNVNYFDEAIFFTDDDVLTNSFRRRFDDLWVNTASFRNFGNVTTPLVRRYPLHPIHPSMNFSPLEDFANRASRRLDAEPQSISAAVFRVIDPRLADAMIRAVKRGVAARLITEPTEYRNKKRLWHAMHVDRMYVQGVQIRQRQHQGLMHQGSIVLHGLNEVIFGSSNWSPSTADEHNYFYHPGLGKAWFFRWFVDQFARKWGDTTNYVPFKPLPPDTPVYSAPLNGASGLGSSVTLVWEGGPWSHLYDVYFGTTSAPPRVRTDLETGSPETGQLERLTVSNLQPGTTYYWRVVGKTRAQLGRSGSTWSFTTSGTAGGTPGSTPYSGSPAAITGTLQAENFDRGGQSVAYYDTTAGNRGGVYRQEDVDIEPTTDSGGGYNVGWTRAGEWLQYTVSVGTTGTYAFDARVANIGDGATFRVEVDGLDKTGPIRVHNTGGWQNWDTVRVSGIPLSAGQRRIRVVFLTVASGGGAGNYNWFRFVQAP